MIFPRVAYVHHVGKTPVLVYREPEGFAFMFQDKDYGFYRTIREALEEIDHLARKRYMEKQYA